jgi:hypothetical protein
MQKKYVHRPFMRTKIRHLGIYEKNTNYISCRVLLKVSFVQLFVSIVTGNSKKIRSLRLRW